MFNYFLLTTASHLPSNEFPVQKQAEKHQSSQINDLKEKLKKAEERYDQLKSKYLKLKNDNRDLKEYICEIEDAFQSDSKKRKIKRRAEEELIKSQSCPYNGCKKEYASKLALNLHIRNKHQGGTKKQRTAFIKKYLQSQQNGTALPPNNLNISQQVLKKQINFYIQNSKKGQEINNNISSQQDLGSNQAS